MSAIGKEIFALLGSWLALLFGLYAALPKIAPYPMSDWQQLVTAVVLATVAALSVVLIKTRNRIG